MTAVVLDHPLPFVITWTAEHIEELKHRCQSETYLSIAHNMGRTEGSVRNKCYDLDIRAVGCLWTAEEEQQLVDLPEKTASEAARILNKTRNAIIGKRHRMGLESKSGMANGRGKLKGPRKPPLQWQRQPRRPRPLATELTDLPSDVSPCAVTFAELATHHCRWPLAAGDYCGAVKDEGCSYCRRHRRIAFVQPRYVRQAPRRLSFALKQRWRAT